MSKRTLHVRVVSPGAIPRRPQVEAAAARLRDAGHRVSLGRHVFASHRYLAGRLSDRLADLVHAFQDPSVDVVWCARGGYGSSELLPHLDAIRLDKPLVGYSDTTSLLGLAAAGGGTAVHGPVFEELVDSADVSPHSALRPDAQNAIDLLSGSANESSFEVRAVGCRPTGIVAGQAWGGNLATLTSLVGTRWARSFAGAMLLLEDVGEPYYRIERLLLQLKQSGALAGAAAVVLGEFHNCPQRGVAASIGDIFAEHLGPIDVPVFCGAPFGHGPRNVPWRLGRPATIRSDRFSWNE